MAIGDLMKPIEFGWQRIDESNENILYKGSYWETTSAYTSTGFGSTTKYLSINDIYAKIAFKFKGAKLRTYGAGYAGKNSGNKIIIDGTEHAMALWSQIENNKIGVSFEITNLEDKEHYVEIIPNGSDRTYLDAIDIDSGGYLIYPIPVEIVDSIDKLKPGTAIKCDFTQLETGHFGHFTSLGNATLPLIPPKTSPATFGSFHFICVGYDNLGRLKLIADRVVKTNISTQTLNDIGYLYGSKQGYFQLKALNAPSYPSGSVVNNEAFALYDYFKTDGKIRTITLNSPANSKSIATGTLIIFNSSGIIKEKIAINGFTSSTETIFGGLDVSVVPGDGFAISSNVPYYGVAGQGTKGRYLSNTSLLNVGSNIGGTVGETAPNCLIEMETNFLIGEDYEIRSLTGPISNLDQENEWYQIIQNGPIAPNDDLTWNFTKNATITQTTPVIGSSLGGATSTINSKVALTNQQGIMINMSGISESRGFRPVLLLKQKQIVEIYKHLIKQGDIFTIDANTWVNHGSFVPQKDFYLTNGLAELQPLTSELSTIKLVMQKQSADIGSIYRRKIKSSDLKNGTILEVK